jgi:hypothetical protein
MSAPSSAAAPRSADGDALLVAAAVAAQMDGRLVGVASGGGASARIDWQAVCASLGAADCAGRAWTPVHAQRLWRWVACVRAAARRGARVKLPPAYFYSLSAPRLCLFFFFFLQLRHSRAAVCRRRLVARL